MKIKNALCGILVLLTGLAACKKEKIKELKQEQISITNLPDWKTEAALVSKASVDLSDADFEKVKSAVGGVDVKFDIGGKLQKLPYSVKSNDLQTVYYYKWQGKSLTIYRQENKAVLIIASPQGEVQLAFYRYPL